MKRYDFNINDILNNAAAENDKAREKKLPEAEASQSKAEAKPENAEKPEKAKSETDEIIGKYSKKPQKQDEKSETDALRRSLACSMANDKELLTYYRSLENKGKSRKVEELYNLINYATQSDVEERNTLETENPMSHFTDPVGNEHEKESTQTKFEGFEDTITLPTEEIEKSCADFDAAYDSLSEKIESGEIDFTDKTDTCQIPIIDETPKTIEKHISDDNSKTSVLDEKDRKLIEIFGKNFEDNREEAEEEGEKKRRYKTAAEKKSEKQSKQTPVYEYVDKSQNNEILEMLTKAIHSSLIRFIISVFLCLGVLYFELAKAGSTWHYTYLQPGRYGILYLLVDIQLLCFIGIVLLDSLKKGAKGLFTGNPCGESVFFTLFAIGIIHGGVTAFLDSEVTYGLFCFPAALCGVCLALVKHLECRKDYHCFRVIASSRSKYVAQKLNGDTKEAMEFYKYLFDDSEIYTTKKTEFVEGFFRRLNTRPESESLSGLIIIVSLIVCLALGGFQLYSGKTVYESVTNFTQAMCFSLPFSSLFIISLPVIKANLIGRRNGSAFIGNAVGEEYDDASVISFADTEVYPSNLVKVSSVKVYGDCRIDEVLYEIAGIFAFVGGPLKTVTGNMISGGASAPANARLIEDAEDGICVASEGHEIFLGKKDYMRRYRFEVPYDGNDGEFEKTNGSVMFVAKDDALIAKVYIKYTINPQFNSLLRDLYRAGMCVGIKTTDPNITNALIEKSVKFKKTPISILKSGEVADVEAESKKVDSGIVANASLHTFLKMFIVCDKVRHITKANGVINIVSVAIAFFVAIFLALTDQMTGLASYYPALFQLLWLFPVGTVSLSLR